MELQARQNKFGESLRMSASATTTRDPLLDEDEDDWVQMKIIEGWSHGYLQMMALLPASVKAIDLHADWIVSSLEKHDLKFPPRVPTPPTAVLTPATPLPSPSVAHATAIVPDRSSEIEKEDEEMLSFTPRKRNGTLSRSASPCPVTSTASPRRPTSMSSSDEATSSSIPHTPETRPSPPPFTFVEHDALSSVDHLQPLAIPPQPKYIMTPHHHALREELSNSLLLPGITSKSNRSFSAPSTSPPHPIDDANPANSSVKSGRSNSFETASANAFVDAKEMLRRRRADAVYGISGANSAAVSDEE